MKRLLTSPWFLFSLGHVMVTTTLLLFLFVRGLGRFDTGEEPSLIDSLADVVFQVLATPALQLWTPFMSRTMPDVVEFAFFLANSALWGAALALVYRSLRTRHTGRARSD